MRWKGFSIGLKHYLQEFVHDKKTEQQSVSEVSLSNMAARLALVQGHAQILLNNLGNCTKSTIQSSL